MGLGCGQEFQDHIGFIFETAKFSNRYTLDKWLKAIW